MPNFIDISGKKFNRLTAICFDHRSGKDYYWKFKCDCGKEKIIRKNSVMSGKVVSCGCYHNEVTSFINRTHHMKGTRLYHCWDSMKQRCYNKNSSAYKYYGQRGISVCKEWKDRFESFMEWSLKNGYKDNLSIDRINVNGNYCPENCKWSTAKEQVRNRRNNVWIYFKGKRVLQADFLKMFNKRWYDYKTKKQRGFSDEEIARIWSN